MENFVSEAVAWPTDGAKRQYVLNPRYFDDLEEWLAW